MLPLHETLKVHDYIYLDLECQSLTLDVTARDVLFYLQEIRRESRLSWLFVKLYKDEPDDVLWELIGEAIGASEEEISSFLFAPSPAELANYFFQMLEWGRTKANSDIKRAAPDVIVIVGGSERVALYEKMPDKSAYPHALMPVLERLTELQLTTSHNEHNGFGRTRIILTPIPKAEPTNTTEPNLTGVEPGWLDLLRVFRGSFDESCAARLLKDVFLTRKELRSNLEWAESIGWLHKLPDGDYLVNRGYGTPLNVKGDYLANLHRQAAFAFAPQMAPNLQRTGLPLSEAAQITNVLEASYHFSMVRVVRDTPCILKDKDRTDQVFLHRFFRRRACSYVIDDALLEQSGLGLEMRERVMDDIENIKASGLSVHPYRFASVAWWGTDAIKHAEDKSKLLGSVIRLIEEGLDACDQRDFAAEKDFLFARVVSLYDCFVAQLREGRLESLLPVDIDKHLKNLNQHVRDLMLNDTSFSLAKAPVGEWYLRCGEDEPDDGKVAVLYARSIVGHPTYKVWPRLFGSIELARGKTDIDVDLLVHVGLKQLRDNPDILLNLRAQDST